MTITDALRQEILDALGKKQEELAASPLPPGVAPIKIRCSWSACRKGRHTLDHFHRPSEGRTVKDPGYCQDCGERVVMLPEPGAVMPLEGDEFVDVFVSLRKELIRAHYWDTEVDLHAYNQALRMGRRVMHEKTRELIHTALLTDDQFWRRRAAYNGKIIAYAQHATGTCCRQCAAYWHGLPRSFEQRPTEAQMDYVVRVARAYLDLRFPDLPEEPTKVGRISTSAKPDVDEILRLDEQVVESLARFDDPAGLVLAKESDMKFISAHDGRGGYITPTRVALPHPGAA